MKRVFIILIIILLLALLFLALSPTDSGEGLDPDVSSDKSEELVQGGDSSEDDSEDQGSDTKGQASSGTGQSSTKTPPPAPAASIPPPPPPKVDNSGTPVPKGKSTDLKMYTHASFETAGVIFTLPSSANGNESARLEVKGPGESYREVHPFTKYDANNMASSIFDLKPGTTYDVRVTLIDPDGDTLSDTAKITTRKNFSYPSPSRTVVVDASGGGDHTSIQAAINAAKPGDHIRVKPGKYGPVSVKNLVASVAKPVVVRADNPSNKPVIDGAGADQSVYFNNSAYVYFDGFEVINGGNCSGGKGYYLRASSNIVVRNSNIHDNGKYGVLITKSNQFPGGALKGGYHLIENNTIDGSKCFPDRTFGVWLNLGPGGGNVIRGNTIRNHWDGIAPCGDEAEARKLSETAAHALDLTGNGSFTNHNLDVYDNDVADSTDDNIELDGMCVNARVFRNTIGDSEANALSTAPTMPGPFFIIRNIIAGDFGQSSIKHNTISAGRSRNVYFYHNTISRTSSGKGAVITLWYNRKDHTVKLRNFVYKNNIISTTADGRLTSAEIGGDTEHPSFDYNLWYTPRSSGTIFEWYKGAKKKLESFAAFKSTSDQEANGIFAKPSLSSSFRPGSGSPAVDAAVRIPGINDGYNGSAPDIGAIER